MKIAAAIPVFLLVLAVMAPCPGRAEERLPAAGHLADLKATVHSTVKQLGSTSWVGRRRAAEQVKLMKDAAVPALLSALRSPSAQVRFSAFRLLVFAWRSPAFAATVLREIEPGSELWILLTKKDIARSRRGR